LDILKNESSSALDESDAGKFGDKLSDGKNIEVEKDNTKIVNSNKRSKFRF
jgi:hypothetical protein